MKKLDKAKAIGLRKAAMEFETKRRHKLDADLEFEKAEVYFQEMLKENKVYDGATFVAGQFTYSVERTSDPLWTIIRTENVNP